MQGRGLGLRNEDGGLQKPDVIIQLPQKRTLVIDSKVSLIGYERLTAVTDQGERNAVGVQFARDVKTHIDALSSKSYQDNSRLAAHDCVLMFVPIEGALAAALTCDPELFSIRLEPPRGSRRAVDPPDDHAYSGLAAGL